MPVQIHGKKGSKRRNISGPSKPDVGLAIPVSPFLEDSSPIKPEPVLSSLEKLPLELLQTIFLYSLNLSLPLASPHLGAALASRHVRTQLVLSAFGDLEDPVESAEPETVKLQSMLLPQKWLTYHFFQHCQKTYMLHLAIRAYQDSVSSSCFYGGSQKIALPDDVQKMELARMSKWFDDYYDASSQAHKPWLRNSIGTLPEQKFKWMDGQGKDYYLSLGIGGERMIIPHEASIYRLPNNELACDIPEKVLRGPWTDDKVQLLTLLLCCSAQISWIDSTSGEVAMQGLEDAIREDNVCAVEALVGSLNKGYSWDEYHSGEPDSETEDENEPKNTVAPLSNWMFQEMQLSKFGAGVKATTQHLKIALLEKGGNREIVQALLGGIGESAIDCDDDEIRRWAYHRAFAQDAGKDNLDKRSISGRELVTALDEHRLWRNQTTICS